MSTTTMMKTMTFKHSQQLRGEVQKWLRNEGAGERQDGFRRLLEADLVMENALTLLMNGLAQQTKGWPFSEKRPQLFFQWLESLQYCLEAMNTWHWISLARLRRLQPFLQVRIKRWQRAEFSSAWEEGHHKAAAAMNSFSEGVLLLFIQAARHVGQGAVEEQKLWMRRVLEEIFRMRGHKREYLHMLFSPEESQREHSYASPPPGIRTAMLANEGKEYTSTSGQVSVRIHREPLQPSPGKPWLHESVWGGRKQKLDWYSRKWME
ncbi:hypothetical protein ACFSO0_11520 [Brevibacillus sp. GCM10020057]|uniref:hypothetical protein n=1 Tax=Brevibacillus sp. GCM10020057 TaxID=3317327 RepID=UPI00363DD25B